MDRQSQKAAVLAYLREGNSLTPMDALRLFGSMRIGARIYELKQEGYDVRSELIKLPSGKIVAQYSLAMERQGKLFA